MSRQRRLVFVLVSLLLVVLWGAMAVLWQWKVPALVRRRLEQWTGHRVTVGAVAINRRLEIVASNVRIAGAPPFEAQTLAWADQVAVRLRGPGGFWSPSEIRVEGLDIEYLGSPPGDNVRVYTVGSQPKAGAQKPGGHASPRLLLRHVRLRGSVALPHAPDLEFRVPDAEIERAPDGSLKAVLHQPVVDVHGLASLRAKALLVEGPARGIADGHWRLESHGSASVDVPGGGVLIDKVSLAATIGHDSAEVKVSAESGAGAKTILTVIAQPGSIDVTMDVPSLSLRPFAAAGAKPGLGLENARAALAVSASVAPNASQGRFDVRAQLSGMDLLHRAVDAEPWRNQAVSVALEGTMDTAAGRIDLKRGNIQALGATVSTKGWLEPFPSPRGQVAVETSRTAPLSCAGLLHAQAVPVKQALAGLELGGALGFAVSLDFNAANWDELRLAVDVSPRCSVIREPEALAELLPVLKKPKADGPAGNSRLPLGPYHPDFTPLAQMPPHLPSAFITAEDSKFFHHHGFDVEMIQHVLAQDLENRSFDRGASTITQQLAKNLFLSHRRTLARKLEEAVLTWRLQRLLSKDRTLELYLNVIELGPGIRGVKQAARTYFGKDIGELTPLESAHLAALTPNPHVLARRFRDGQIDEGWQQRLYDLLGMMKRHGRLSAEELAQARNARLELRDLGK